MMKFLKILGWSVFVLILLTGVVYGFLPAIGTMLITQGLTTRGLTNVEITIDRPGLNSLTIPWLTFRTPPESGATSISIENMEIIYSLDSLLNNVVENVNVERVKIVWDSSLLEKPSAPSASPPMDSGNLRAFGSGSLLPVLPFQHLRITHVDISNPLAPPMLQQVSLNANMDAGPDSVTGSVQLEGDGLLLNHLTFSLKHNGTASLAGTHTSTPDDPVIDLHTSLEPSTSGLALHGQATLNLHPVIHTLAAIYPLPTDYQAVTGKFSGTWIGTLPNQPSQPGASLGPIQGEFTLDAHMPTWPPLGQDIQIEAQGTFFIEGTTLNVLVEPSSSGKVHLALDSLTPAVLLPFLSHQDLRSVQWDIQQPIRVVVPIQNELTSIQVPSGQIHVSMQNATEQLDVRLSPQGLLWKSSNGIEGKGRVSLSTHIKPAATPSLRLETLSLQTKGTVSLAASQIEIALNPTSLLHLSNVKNETMHLPILEGRFPQGLFWIYQTEPRTWALRAPASILVLPTVSIQGQEWKMGEILTQDLTMTATPETWEVKGESSVTQVQPPTAAFKIPSSNWQLQYAVNPTSITAQFTGQTREHPIQVGGHIRHDAPTGEGTFTMALQPLELSPPTRVLSQFIQPWPNPDMDVTHGTASASVNVNFRKSLKKDAPPFQLTHLHGIVDLNGIGGFFKPTIIEGLTTHVEILGNGGSLQIPPTPLRIKNIQSAVTATETSLLLSADPFPPASIPAFSIKNLRTHLLGGTVSTAHVTIDPQGETHEVPLQVSGLDLNEVLRLEQQETVKGTGTLDGTLPLFISRTDSGIAVTVQQGSIQGRSPGGTLHFEVDKETASAWAKSQPQLDLIVKSLENYHYSKLEVGVDYEKNGILKLATTLEGKNPDFRNGVPIHFNLNIEENIPALIKSLSLVNELEQKIEKMMTQPKKPKAKNQGNH